MAWVAALLDPYAKYPKHHKVLKAQTNECFFLVRFRLRLSHPQELLHNSLAEEGICGQTGARSELEPVHCQHTT